MKDLYVYNTMSRSKERFVPLDPEHVRMYVCGPTVYSFAHIGNARPVVVFDTLYRLLKRRWSRVTYARNITDVNDKIMDRAKETGEEIHALTVRTTVAFHEDMEALGTLLPDIEPRATEYIPQMIALAQILIDKNHAYVVDGHVLFHVPSMPEYGALSRHSRDELIAGARVEVAPYKKDPADFVLWKPSTPDQQGWDSPWGRGRPGWHIECSAMAEENLGQTFDIHGGGLDLIFPHHENEIAQSTCAHNGAAMAKYWIHNGFLTVNSDKMSKSLGNVLTVRELLSEVPGEAIRLALLAAQYRQPLDFSLQSLQSARNTLDRWYSALRKVPATAGQGALMAESVPTVVEDALADDLNTPQAIAAIHELAAVLNAATTEADKQQARQDLLAAGHALGVLQLAPDVWFHSRRSDTNDTLSDVEVEGLIAARAAARVARDFAESDRLRDCLTAAGIVLEDGADGTVWRRR